ncbi:MAG: YraN family protein [Cellvibrionales bacterium]|nr:YraN family protein [Cellvibrionales bacterium]HCH20189.1 YraN family protein [Cellvibrionales bacterium]
MVNTLKIGEETEAAALQFLLRQGLSLITRNYRCQYGEIDLIMQDITSVVFIEVRYRRHAEFGGSANSITTQKQKKIRNTALHFLQHHRTDAASRFDVIAMSPSETKIPYTIDWIQNAFM